MSDRCVVSVAFRDPYTKFQKIQLHALREYYNGNIEMFTDEYPIGNMKTTDDIKYFENSYYGFKPHAIRECMNAGYTQILWLDSAIVPIKPIDFAFEKIKEHGMITNYADGLASLNCKEKVLEYFKVKKPVLDFHNVRYAGGSVYGFDMTNPKVLECFEMWEQAEKDSCFGSGYDMTHGNHKTDEVCMAICQYKVGLKIPEYREFYQNNDRSLWLNLKENMGLWDQ